MGLYRGMIGATGKMNHVISCPLNAESQNEIPRIRRALLLFWNVKVVSRHFHLCFQHRNCGLVESARTWDGPGNRLWVRFLAMSDIYHIPCSYKAYDYLGPSKISWYIIMAWHTNCVEQRIAWFAQQGFSSVSFCAQLLVIRLQTCHTI